MCLSRLRKDSDGGALLEFTVVFFLFFLLLGGLTDYMYIFWQRNMLVKSVERGARIAAVSNPVASGLENNNSALIAPGGCDTAGNAGKAYPAGAFDCVCNGSTGACSAGPNGACGLAYDAAAMATIAYGRGGTAATCGAAGKSTYSIGMCDLFKFANAKTGTPFGPANLIVEYADTGLGFCGRRPGPVPTVTVRVQNVTLNHFFLGGGFPGGVGDQSVTSGANAGAPATTSITGEDLSYSAPP